MNPLQKNVLIVAGETSADIHAANLIRSLKEINPNLAFFGMGGKRMEKEGVELVERMEHLSIIGLLEVFTKLKHIRGAYKKIMNMVDRIHPDAAILVDYPGFNLTLARALKKRRIKVIYYITPQVWVWGKFRIRLLKKYVDKAIVILKFEEAFFKKYNIDVTFVGHPLLDVFAKDIKPDKKQYGLAERKMTIALLPGSRESEVKRILPLMLRTAEKLSEKKDLQFILLKSSSVNDAIYNDILEKSKLSIAAVKDSSQAGLVVSDFVFTSSGTATLESAICQRPMLITYKATFLTFLLFKIFARKHKIGLVNIIAGREIAPEILQYDACPARLASEILSIISSKEKLEEQVQGLDKVKRALGTRGASERAAKIIDDFITQQR